MHIEELQTIIELAKDTHCYDMFKSGTSTIMKSVNKAKKLFKIGDKVKIYDDMLGEIVGYNTSGGFYDGERYPLKIKLDHSGNVFEYGINCINKI
jgi:hypothetical protein